MATKICPHCKKGGFMYTCKSCGAEWCAYSECKKTITGKKYDHPVNQCPICKKWGTGVKN